MGNTIKVLLVGMRNLNRNYGVQGLTLPIVKLLNTHFTAKYIFVLSHMDANDKSIYKKYTTIKTISAPHPFVILGRRNFLFYIFYAIVKRNLKGELKKLFLLIKHLKASDVVIDVSGIEFIGNRPVKTRYPRCINTISMQWLAEKNCTLYIKYTKSYGPISNKDKIYKSIAKKWLNKLPFLFVRGESNLKKMKNLGLKIPLFSFPDVSLSLEVEEKNWALAHVSKLGIDVSKKIVGLSPSTVISNVKTGTQVSSCGREHIVLCRKIIDFYRKKGLQVLLIPHSIDDGYNLKSCDLALCKKIYNELENKIGVYILDDFDLTYAQVRAIIGLLDFYVTGRYHSLASALSMAVPVIALSWHIKYRDIMSLFLDDFLAIDCRTTSIEKSIALIEKYYCNREWFDKKRVFEKKQEILKEIDNSIIILATKIRKINSTKKNMEKC